jgi:hypothetical protein
LISRYQEEQDALISVASAQGDSIDKALASQQADLTAASAIDEYNKSQKTRHGQIQEGTQDFLDIEQKIRSASETAGDYAVNAVKASGATTTAAQDAKTKTDAQIASLEKERDTVAPGSPLYAAIQGWIDLLNSTPTHVNTDFTISGAGGNAGPRVGPGGAPARKAAGGPVSAGVPYWIGEEGPELMVPSSSGSIVPNRQLAAVGATSGTTIVNNHNNYFTVDRSADQASIGRAIAESLKAYERASGTGWRN